MLEGIRPKENNEKNLEQLQGFIAVNKNKKIRKGSLMSTVSAQSKKMKVFGFVFFSVMFGACDKFKGEMKEELEKDWRQCQHAAKKECNDDTGCGHKKMKEHCAKLGEKYEKMKSGM